MNKDKVSLRAMCAYEKLTGRNALQTLQVGDKMSATDLMGLLFMVAYTKDQTTTMDKIEALDQTEISKLMAELTNAAESQSA